MDEFWYERLRELICQLYRAWGGACDELGESAPEWIAALVGTYGEKGAPTFGTTAAKDEFLATLDLLEVHLSKPGNSLSTADTAALTQLIADLRADLSQH